MGGLRILRSFGRYAMGKKFSIWLYLFLAAGVLILCYPALSSAVNRRSGSFAIGQWQQDMVSLESGTLEEQRLRAQRYNQQLLETGEAEGYEACLNLGNGMMGYIQIPKIDVELPIYHGVDEDTLARGVGHLPGSSLPIGGEGNHAVLTGHTGLPSARLFTDLIALQEGDRFYVHTLDQALCYQVDQIMVVLPTQGEELMPRAGEDYCTLVTCTPYGINSHRLLVRGRRVLEAESIPAEQAQEQPERRMWLLWLPAALCAVAVIAFVWRRSLDVRRGRPYNRNEKTDGKRKRRLWKFRKYKGKYLAETR